MVDSVYAFEAKSINGEKLDLAQFKGKALLIVNTASNCGFTSQYKGLEDLFQEYSERDFVVLGFPCNQFGAQEPNNNEEIGEFCRLNYGVSFPMFQKVEVNGEGAHPLFKYLCEKAPGVFGSKAIKWNFTKFLVNNQGVPIKRFAPKDSPDKIAGEIEQYLN
ncbi:MAG: glutathione peroxidase [Oligoflexales bacterium]